MSISASILRHLLIICAIAFNFEMTMAQTANLWSGTSGHGNSMPFAGSNWVMGELGKTIKSMSRPVGPFTVHTQDMIYTFKVKEPVTVYTASGKSRPIHLKVGDVVDMAAPEDLIADSPIRRGMTDKFYVPLALSQKYAKDRMRMSVRSSGNALENGTEIFLKGENIQKLEFSSMGAAVFTADDIEEGEAVDSNFSTEGDFCVTCKLEEAARMNPLSPVNQIGTQLISGIAIDAAFNGYSNSNGVSKLVSFAKNNYYTVTQTGRKIPLYIARDASGKITTTYCYRAIKKFLIASGMVPPTFGQGSAHAYMAKDDLKKAGFKNLLDDHRMSTILKNPNMAPKGAILVYKSTDRSVSGHVEIKTQRSGIPGYVSIDETDKPAFGMATPRLDRNGGRPRRELIGVMVKS